jgi:hypothetical protein
MPSSRKKGIPKRRGRPATGRDPVVPVRLPSEIIERIDVWGSRQHQPADSRSEAIRRLVELGLGQSTPLGRTSQKVAQQASALAVREVDRMVDTAAPPKEQAKRKRRLLKGPREFRDIRKDHPKG